MGKYTWLLCPGHGGIIDGEYQTSTKWWKRSYFKNGELLDADNNSLEWLEANCDFKHYEGVSNRLITKEIMRLCKLHGIKCIDVVDTEKEMSLSQRVANANDFWKKDRDCIFLSIHSNAFDKESAQGFSIYTTPGFTNSDKIAPIIFKEMAIEFDDHKPRADRTDGDPDKEALFYVLKNTYMPAVLSENLFYTNWREAQILGSEEGIKRVANAHFRAMVHIDKYGF